MCVCVCVCMCVVSGVCVCVCECVCVCVVSGGVYVCVFVCDYLHVRGTEGLSSFEGIQIFWILFWVSSLGIPLGLGSIRLNTAARYTPASAVCEHKRIIKK